MPKKLLIVRHAQAEPIVHGLNDFDRPLNEKGKAEASKMATRMYSRQIIPQYLLSSPALRAFTTAEYFAGILGFNKQEITSEASIYDATASTLLHVINCLENKYDFVALFGHNPGVTTLAVNLCNTDIYHIPTCGIVLIEFPFDDWKLVSKGTGDMKLFDYPEASL